MPVLTRHGKCLQSTSLEVPAPVSHSLNTMRTNRLIHSCTIKRESHGLILLSVLAEKARTLIILTKLMVIFKSKNKGGQSGSWKCTNNKKRELNYSTEFWAWLFFNLFQIFSEHLTTKTLLCELQHLINILLYDPFLTEKTFFRSVWSQ